MFVKVRRVFTACSILFLTLLFLLPARFLRGWHGELNELSGQVLAYAQAGNTVMAAETYGALRDEYEIMRKVAELFLDHKVMDDATVPLRLMGVYLDAGDVVSLRAAAAEFQQALDCMLAIETGDLRLLL